MSYAAQARRLARMAVAAAASGAALGAGVGVAYLAGGAAGDVARASVAPVGVTRTAAHAATILALRPAPIPILDALLVTGRRSLGDGAARLNPAFLQRLSWRSGPAYQAPSAYAAADAAGGGDLGCLTAAVYYEARGEPEAGQAAVAQVVLNRVRNPRFPKTVCGVVYQGVGARTCQFSFACDGSMNRRTEPAAWDRAKGVAQRALDGYVMPDVGHAVSYHTVSLGNLWGRTMIQIARIGQHIFYGFLGGAAAPTADDGSNATVTVIASPATAPVNAASPAAVASASVDAAAAAAAPKPAADPMAASAGAPAAPPAAPAPRAAG